MTSGGSPNLTRLSRSMSNDIPPPSPSIPIEKHFNPRSSFSITGSFSSTGSTPSSGSLTSPRGPTQEYQFVDKLKVTIAEAKNLAPKDKNGVSSDPFVVVKLRKKEEKTKVAHNTLNPVWNTEQSCFIFEIDEDDLANDTKMKFTVWDKNKMSNDYMGETSISITSLIKSKEKLIDKWYPLESEKEKETVSGELHVVLELIYSTVETEDLDILSSSGRAKFFQRFPSVPTSQKIQVVFNCALSQKKIPMQGVMYILDNYICFYANLLGKKKKVIIDFQQIDNIEKKFPNAVEISLKENDKKYFFESFIHRNRAYDSLMTSWGHKPEPSSSPNDAQPMTNNNNAVSRSASKTTFDKNRIISQSVQEPSKDKESGHRHRRSSSLDTKDIDKAVAESTSTASEQVTKAQDLHVDPRISSSPSPFPVTQPVFKSPSASHRRGKSVQIAPQEQTHLIPQSAASHHPININVKVKQYKELKSEKNFVVTISPSKPVQSLLNQLGQLVGVEDVSEFTLYVVDSKKNKQPMDPLNFIYNYNITDSDHVTFSRKKKSGIAQYLHAIRNNEDNEFTQNQILLNVDIVDYEKLKVQPKTTIVLEGDVMISQVISKIVSEGNVHIPEKKIPEYTLCIMKSPDRGIIPDDTSQFISLYGLQDKDTIKLVRVFPIKSVYEKFNVKADRPNKELAFELCAHCVLFPFPDGKSGNSTENPENKNGPDNNNASTTTTENPPRAHRKTHSRVGSLSKKNSEETVPEPSTSNPSITPDNSNLLEYEQQQKLLKMLSQYLGLDSKTSQQIIGNVSKMKEVHGNSAEIFLVELFYRLQLIDVHPFYKQQIFQNVHHFVAWRTREIDAITKNIRSIIFNPATFVGVLNINVLSCKNIAPQNKGGTADTYCVLKVEHDKQNAKTKIQRKNLHPTFNEHFKFTITHPSTSLNVLLIDKDQNITGMSNDSVIGEVSIPLSDLYNGNMVDQWFSFNTAGRIHLQLQLCYSNAKYVRCLESMLESLKTNSPQPVSVPGSPYNKLSISMPRLPTMGQKLSSSFSDLRRDFPSNREHPIITVHDDSSPKPRSPERLQRNLTQPLTPGNLTPTSSSPNSSRSSSPNFETKMDQQQFPPLQPSLDDLVNSHFLYKIMMKKILFSTDTINCVKKDKSEIIHTLIKWLLEHFEKRFGIHKEFRNVIMLYYIDGILQPLPNQLILLSEILAGMNQFRPLATKIEHEMIETGLKSIRKSLHQFVTHYIKYFPKNIPENGLNLSIQCINLLQNYHTSNIATNLIILKQHYGSQHAPSKDVSPSLTSSAPVSPKLQGLLIECLQDAVQQIYQVLRNHAIEENSQEMLHSTSSHHSETGSVHSFVNNDDDDVIVNHDDDESQPRSDTEQQPAPKPQKEVLSLAELCSLCEQISVDIDQQNFFKETFSKWGVNFEQEVGNRYYILLMEDVKQFCEHTDYTTTAVATVTTGPPQEDAPVNVFDLYFKLLSLVDNEESTYFSNVAERQNLMDMFTIFVYGWMKQIKADLRNITDQAKDSKGVNLSLALSPVTSSRANQQLTTEALTSIFGCYTRQFEFFRSLKVDKPFIVIQFAEILCDVAPKFVNLTYDRAMEEISEQENSNKNFSVSKMLCFSLNDIHEANNRLKFLKNNLTTIFEKALTAEVKLKQATSEDSKENNKNGRHDEFSVTLRESFQQCFDHAFAAITSKLQSVITTISNKVNLQLNQLLLQGVAGMTPQAPTINVKVIKEYIDTQLVSLSSYLYPELFKLILSKVWEDILQDLENLLLSETVPNPPPAANSGASVTPTASPSPILMITPFQVKGLLPFIEELSAFFYVSGKGLSKQFVDSSTEFLRKILELWLQTTSSLIDLWFKLPYLPSETKAKVIEAPSNSNANNTPSQKTINKNHVYILIHYRTRNSNTNYTDKEAKSFCQEQTLIKENRDFDKIAWLEKVRVHFRLQPTEMILEHYPQAAVSIRETEKSEDKNKYTGFAVLTSTHFCFDTKMDVPSSQKQEKGFIETFIDQKIGGPANLKIALPLKDIVSLEKKTKSYFWDSIRITVKSGKVYHFDGFPNRDVAWKDIVDQLIAVGNSQFKIIQS